MRGKSIIIICSLILGSALAAAEEEKKLGFYGSVAWGGSKTTGNTESEVHDAEVVLGYKQDVWSNEFSFKGKQIKDAGVTTSDYYEFLDKSVYELPYHVYMFFILGYREDFFGGIYSEQSYVMGLGYHFFEAQPDYSLDVEAGYGERVAKKVDRIKIDHDLGMHFAIIAQYNFSDDDVIKALLSGEFGNDDDYIKKELSWKHNLYQGLNVEFAYEARTITVPEFGKVSTDATYTGKIGYEF